MSKKNEQANDPGKRYGISRVDDPEHRHHAWRVSLRRRGQLLVRNFPDKKWGGTHKALIQARRFRDELLALHKPITRREFADSPRKNNTSGVTGVSFIRKKYVLANGRKREIQYWEAIWPTQPGSHLKKLFSVSTYGNEKAFELACRARRNGLRKVGGYFWVSDR